MNTIILRALRREAQLWWAHKDLRSAGRTTEAQNRERESIRSQLSTIRRTLESSNAYISAGRGGTCIHAKNMTVSSYGSLKHFATARVLIALGVPFVDTNPVEHPTRLIGLPLVAVGRDADPAPWTSLSYAPLEAYLRGALLLGATVINLPWLKEEIGGPKDIRSTAEQNEVTNRI